MKFYEAIEKINQSNSAESIIIPKYLLVEYIEQLREEYAPTVEMTKEQRDLILRNQDEDKLYEIMGTEDGYYFDSLYWGDLEPHEVAQAYLHPETIKAVERW